VDPAGGGTIPPPEGEPMTARARDAFGIAILLTAGVAARIAWHPLGPWVSLGIAFAGALAVMAVYRMRPRRVPPAPRSTEAGQPRRVLLRQD
jgi:hypothetical protein